MRELPHVLIQAEHVLGNIHGRHFIGRFNARLAVLLTNAVGTMYCAYLFTVIAVVALPEAVRQGSPTVLVNWLSSNFIQLVLLPIIIVGQRVLSEASDAQAAQDHKILMAIHENTELLKEVLGKTSGDANAGDASAKS